MSIKLNGINCFYGAHQALFDITLNCPEGETLVLLGPSGAGKSSLLRVLNLLEMPRSGTLAIAGNHRHGLPAIQSLATSDGAAKPD